MKSAYTTAQSRLLPKMPRCELHAQQIELDWHADPRPLISTIEAIIAEDSSEAKHLAYVWLRGALCKRDFDGARRAMAALPIDGCYDDTIPFPRSLVRRRSRSVAR